MVRRYLPSILLVSYNEEWCELMRAAFKGNPRVRVLHEDIQTLDPRDKAFVSPANCLGFMDGGIDFPLSRVILPGCETLLRTRIQELGILTALGRPCLPIGSAILVPIDELSSALISAPTMFLPHNVAKTRNAYWSTRAALEVWFKWREAAAEQGKKRPYDTIVLTSHCCGIGGMSVHECAKQMYEAIKESEQPRFGYETNPHADADIVLGPDVREEQPETRDIKEISIESQQQHTKID